MENLNISGELPFPSAFSSTEATNPVRVAFLYRGDLWTPHSVHFFFRPFLCLMPALEALSFSLGPAHFSCSAFQLHTAKSGI